MRVIFFLLCVCTSLTLLAYKALVIAPVADLIGSPIQMFYPNLAVDTAYQTIPLCGGNQNRWNACVRTEQLIFNEIVDVLEKKGKEAKVRVSRSFYITQENPRPHTDYWTLAHNLIRLDTLSTAGIDMRMIPEPINFEFEKQHNDAITALLFPFHDPVTGLFFSAGTRFVCAKTPRKSPHINVFVYNPPKQLMEKIKIPKNICVFYDKKHTFAERRSLFVSYVKQWAHLADGFIPYVWGGSSFVYPYDGLFVERTVNDRGYVYSFFEYPHIYHYPHTGFDCSGLIARAAQLADIPYFYKNTYTISQKMTPLAQGEHLQNGDLIWTPGHIVIVADIAKNTLIEARSYFQGFGKVQEIELNKVFKNVNTYKELEDRFFGKKAIERLDIHGTIRNTIPLFLLVNLEKSCK